MALIYFREDTLIDIFARKGRRQGRKAVQGCSSVVLPQRCWYVSGKAIEQEKPMKSEPSQLRDFGTRYTAAWCSGEAESVAALYSPSGSA